jgi:hypothetical protein
VKEIDAARNPWRGQQLVEGCRAREVALPGRDPVVRYEAADFSLELGESHFRTSAARRNASRSPCRWM